MIIKSIKLTNFRNHTKYTLNCKDETSLILGENGCGKTSVLEAIYILTRGKSFRAADPDILKHGAKYYRIELEYQNGEKITATYDGKTKSFIVLDQKTKRLPKKSHYPVVLFLPSDLNLINHSPSSRRDYFDRVFSSFNEKYNISLLKYEKALKQRNELLKDPNLQSKSLFSWNILLAKYGVELYKYRKSFIEDINKSLTKTYHSIAKNNDQIELFYKTELLNPDENSYFQELEKCFSRDSLLGHTTFGIHHDDFIFMFNQKEASGSASRGETRSIILALKFIEAELIYQKQQLQPLILLDDVFSELDQIHRQSLVTNFKHHQVIITSVEEIND